jgi:serine/threonine-protein kinase
LLDRLGDFTLIELLGEGGMGAVYRARQESLARDVAVKILPERLTRNPKFVQRFYREARAAAGLVHPNVVQIYSIGQDEDRGVHYYAMELVRGQDLAQILKGGVRFSVDQALTIVLQAAEGLAAAAESGLIHRDIKPANMMLSPKGQVKIMDFGLAKMAAGDAIDVTEAGSIVGTASYMSPEQGLGKELDFRTDIYSLGAVLYELLTGRPPFKADDPSAVIYLHVYEQPKRPGELNPRVPPPVERLVLRMLAKQPDERFGSPNDLLAELKKLKRTQAEPLPRIAPAAAPRPPPPPAPGREARPAPALRSRPPRPPDAPPRPDLLPLRRRLRRSLRRAARSRSAPGPARCCSATPPSTAAGCTARRWRSATRWPPPPPAKSAWRSWPRAGRTC